MSDPCVIAILEFNVVLDARVPFNDPPVIAFVPLALALKPSTIPF